MIYLDNSATTKPREEVMETFVKASAQFYANPASLHTMGNAAEDLLESARRQIAGALQMDTVYFTSGGTEANNLALSGVAHAYAHRGKHIITCVTEHPAVLNAALALEQQGFEITRLPVDAGGHISLEDLQQALRPDTILVSLMHVNNEIGTIHPITEIRRLLDGKRIFLHVDAVQSAGKLAIPADARPDLLTVSAHKLHGLKGSGILAVNNVALAPIIHGGGQESGVRSGTVSVPHAAAFAKALRLAAPSPDQTIWNAELRAFFTTFDRVKIVSPQGAAPHILAVALSGVKGEVVVSGLQQQGVIVSTSSACSSKNTKTSHVIEAIGLPQAFRKGVIRISFGDFTNRTDIDKFKQAFQNVYEVIKGV